MCILWLKLFTRKKLRICFQCFSHFTSESMFFWMVWLVNRAVSSAAPSSKLLHSVLHKRLLPSSVYGCILLVKYFIMLLHYIGKEREDICFEIYSSYVLDLHRWIFCPQTILPEKKSTQFKANQENNKTCRPSPPPSKLSPVPPSPSSPSWWMWPTGSSLLGGLLKVSFCWRIWEEEQWGRRDPRC